MGTCVSWILILSHALLLGVSVLGLWASIVNFGEDLPAVPTPPPDVSLTTTTRRPNDYYSRESDLPRAFRKYVDETEAYASLTNDPRFFVALPCGAVALTTLITFLAGLCSRKIFTTTTSLYSNLVHGAFVVVLMVIYQYRFIDDSFSHIAAAWVVGIQAALMLLLIMQVILSMWELRRQKASWPTINISNIFTVECLFLAARLTLGVFVIIFYMTSVIVNGMRIQYGEYNVWESPTHGYPVWLGLSAGIAALFTFVAAAEPTLSFFLGVTQTRLVWMTALIASLCNAWIAVLTSPVFIRSFIGTYHYYSDYIHVMIFAIVSSIVAFIHTLLCLFTPGLLRTPPKIVRLAAEKLSTLSLADIMESGFPSMTSDVFQPSISHLGQKMHNNPILINNLVSTVTSVVLILILGVSWDSPMYRSWGAVILMAVDVEVLLRCVPALVLQLGYSRTHYRPFAERVIRHTLECVAVLVGAIGLWANTRSYEVGFQIGGAFNFIFFCAQTALLLKEHKKEPTTVDSNAAATTQLLEESETDGETDGDNDPALTQLPPPEIRRDPECQA